MNDRAPIDLRAEAVAEFHADIAKGKVAILEAERKLYIEVDSLLYDGFKFPLTLDCGCKVRLEDDWMEGDTIRHTKRVWDLCEAHEALRCEP